MSPVNSDDSPGDAFGASGRPLTRKEIRAREKSHVTQGHEAIPPQAYETGQDHPAPAPAAPSVRLAAADTPELPAAEPTVHEDAEPEAAHQVVAPEHPAHEEVAPEAAYAAPEDTAHEYAGGPAAEAGAHPETGFQRGYEAHPAAEHHGYEAHPDDEAHDPYGDEALRHPDYHHDDDGQGVMPGAIRTATGPSKKVRRRRRFLALVLTLTVFVVAIVVGAQFLKPLLGGDAVADYPGPGTGEVSITVPPGAGPKSVATELQNKKVVANADSFLKEFAASGGALSPGDFSMRTEMKNSDAVALLLNKDKGKVMYVALSAGLRIGESLQAISEGTGVPVGDLKSLSDSPEQFGVPAKSKNLEGFLAPGEYRFPLGTPAKDILKKLVSTTLDELKSQGVTDQAKQYDVVTVASIVQAEGGQAEYGDVAGAIYNRLKPTNTETNGLIQSDATVTYGLGIRSFHIDEEQKADASNPYNTYANVGLPAGPIGSPGKTAIDAAAKPKSNDYLYWVTINLDTKETKFSKTLAEHGGYVEKYNAWCEANPGRCV
ncbi:endolytic transglycosylase MltG [Arthrobacter sp. UYCu712]|uniref:endolytic transglycosylase MltG n=1 Tax=Arthrobacter sp. UYCu712 TaxID=3156340 RepID=UPI0033974746